MQADVKNFFDGAELQFREKTAGELFGIIGETAFGHAGNTAQRQIQFVHAIAHGARKNVAQ